MVPPVKSPILDKVPRTAQDKAKMVDAVKLKNPKKTTKRSQDTILSVFRSFFFEKLKLDDFVLRSTDL